MKKVITTVNVEAKNLVGAVRWIRASAVKQVEPILAWDVAFPDEEVEERLKKYLTTKQDYGGVETEQRIHLPVENHCYMMLGLGRIEKAIGVTLLFDTLKEETQEGG